MEPSGGGYVDINAEKTKAVRMTLMQQGEARSQERAGKNTSTGLASPSKHT